MSSIIGKIRYQSVVGKSVGSRSYSDGTPSRVVNTSVWFGGVGATYFALGGDGVYDIGSPGTTPGIVSGFAAKSRVSLRNLRFRWRRTDGSASTVDANSRSNVTVFVADASTYNTPVSYIWNVFDPIVSTSTGDVEHVYGDMASISIPAGSNIFVYLNPQVSGSTGTIVGEMSCEMVIDD